MTENSAKFNILKYAPENLTVEIMMKYPPKDIIELCKSKDRRIRELCQNFLSKKDYQRMWGGVPHPKTYKKEDLDKLEKDVNIIEPNLEILITNLKNQPIDIQKMILMKTKPKILLALCSVKDKAIQKICDDKNFLEKYGKLYKKNLQRLLNLFSEDREISELLTIFGDYVDPSADDNYPIREAAENGHTEIVKLLLKDKRVDPRAQDNYAIASAARNGHLEIVKLLLKDRRVNPGDDDNYAIRWAADEGHLEVVKVLLKDDRVDPSAQDNYAIRIAARYGHLEVVKLLLEDDRVNPSDNHNNPIIEASENGHLEVVKLLLEDDRVDPSDDDNYAIRLAAGGGHLEVVKLLLEDSRVDPSAKDNDAIRRAAEYGHTEIVELLKKYK